MHSQPCCTNSPLVFMCISSGNVFRQRYLWMLVVLSQTGCVLQAWESDVESTIVSKLHSEVSQVMGSIGISHNIERITDDGLFSADILIEDDKVIVEVDGPHHFTVNTHQPLGKL